MSADFLDTNVFVYLVDRDEPRSRIAREVVESAIQSGKGHISSQVVQESLNVITRKIAAPVSLEDAKRFLRETLVPLWTVYPTPALYERALDLAGRYSYHFHDSLILAAAIEAHCDRLLTEDFQHGQLIDGLTIYNPFA